MKEEHLDLLVTEAILARLEKPDFLATLDGRDDDTDGAREEILAEMSGHQAWLD